MATMKEGFSYEDKTEELEYEAQEDKLNQMMHCTACGNTPKIAPVWLKENWFAGECDTCNDYEEFYLDIEDGSEI